MKEKHQRYLIIILVILDIIFVGLNQSTYDSGDSILHYMQAKQSFEHPRYFMNHWAKPIFVLLSSSFAQFGFIGMKVFNTLCVLGSIYFCERILHLRKFKNRKVIWVLGLFSIHIFLVQSSGLTEPLAALFLSVGIYLFLKNRLTFGLTILSFLPFIRSEGWVMLCVVIVMLLYQKRWRLIPLVTLGTVIYGIVGFFYYHDFLWMFHQNPYSGSELKYGSGDILHFVNQMPYLLGWPTLIMMVFGLIAAAISFVKSTYKITTYHFLIVGMFLAMLVSHSIFWHQGWFHSFGMKRVLLAVFPCMILLAFDGFQFITNQFQTEQYRRIAVLFLLATIMVFPFTPNKAAFAFPYEFEKDSSQEAASKAVAWYKDHITDQPVVSFGNYYFAELLQVDIDDTKEVLLHDAIKKNTLPSGSIVFWDNYFSVTDMGVTIEDFSLKDYELLHSETLSKRKHTSVVHVYQKK